MTNKKIAGRVLKVLLVIIFIEILSGISCMPNARSNSVIVANDRELFLGKLSEVLHTSQNPDSVQLYYITKYANIAWEDYKTYNFPVSIKLAQFLLESGVSSNSPKGSNVLILGNNGFGIKYFGDSYFKRIPNYKQYVTTYKYVLAKDDCPVYCRFIDFNTIEDSFRYHTLYMVGTQKRPSHYMKHISTGDASNWLYAIDKGGYATSEGYIQSLLYIIKKYNLNLLDI